MKHAEVKQGAEYLTRIATVLRRVQVVASTVRHGRAAWVVLNPRTGKTLVRSAAALRPVTATDAVDP